MSRVARLCSLAAELGRHTYSGQSHMQASTLPPATLLAFGVLWILGAVGGLYFWFGSNAGDKRQLYPWVSGVMLVGVLGFAYFVVQPPLGFFGLLAIFGTLSTVVHARSTLFCPQCARMIYRGPLAARVNYCPRCGRPLDQSHTPAAPTQ